ncbi:hypothetical protein Cni_G09427 [Canna indica]|uniref:CBM20 domain-containing protein n=1 Tax=Canna indica TaxID=4628 RepID=A0AAQ3K2B2_9LILI|nr:hypothetical protein Cni_G09427 [Canna indica]
MDALARHCIAGLPGDVGRVALLLSSSPSRTRSCIWTPLPTKKAGSRYGALVLRRLIRFPSSSSLAAASLEVDELTPDAPLETTEASKTVHVRFVLHKECAFGQQFFLAGDDPMFGLWDPSNAIPMEWSSGHVWIAELDMPVRRQIQFKFVLKDLSGEVQWQPGSDRSLQTWETTKTIVVSEDWDNENELLIVHEEEESTEINVGGNTGVVMDQVQVGIADEINSDSKSHGEKLIGEGGLVLVPGLPPLSAPVSSEVLVPGLPPLSSPVSTVDSPQETMAANVADASLKSDEAGHYNSSQLSGEEDISRGSDGSVHEVETMLALQQPPLLLQQLDGGEYEEMQNTESTPDDKILLEEQNSESTAEDKMLPEEETMLALQQPPLLLQQLDGGEYEEMQNTESTPDDKILSEEQNSESTAEDKLLPEERNSESTADILQNDIQWGLGGLKQFLTILGFS